MSGATDASFDDDDVGGVQSEREAEFWATIALAVASASTSLALTATSIILAAVALGYACPKLLAKMLSLPGSNGDALVRDRLAKILAGLSITIPVTLYSALHARFIRTRSFRPFIGNKVSEKGENFCNPGLAPTLIHAEWRAIVNAGLWAKSDHPACSAHDGKDAVKWIKGVFTKIKGYRENTNVYAKTQFSVVRVQTTIHALVAMLFISRHMWITAQTVAHDWGSFTVLRSAFALAAVPWFVYLIFRQLNVVIGEQRLRLARSNEMLEFLNMPDVSQSKTGISNFLSEKNIKLPRNTRIASSSTTPVPDVLPLPLKVLIALACITSAVALGFRVHNPVSVLQAMRVVVNRPTERSRS